MYLPQFPYNGSQLILNSNRVLINSKSDSIFLFSSKSICLSSNEGIHFNTEKEVIINSSKIQLGIDAKEPIPRGNKLKSLLERQSNDIISAANQLLSATDSNGNSIPSVQAAGQILLKSAKRTKIQLKNLNSEQNFTL
jgi:uncharacterized protein YcfL